MPTTWYRSHQDIRLQQPGYAAGFESIHPREGCPKCSTGYRGDAGCKLILNGMRKQCIISALIGLVACSPPLEDGSSVTETEQLAMTQEVRPAQENALGSAYARYLSDTASKEGQTAFFDAFPTDFAELKSEFGFEEIGLDSVAFAPNYYEAEEIIMAFFNLDKVPIQNLASKAVDIAKNGIWQEDGVNHFQHQLGELFAREPDAVLAAIEPLPHSDQAGFWKFFLDGPVAYPKEDAERLRTTLMGKPLQLALVDSLLAVAE